MVLARLSDVVNDNVLVDGNCMKKKVMLAHLTS